MSDGTFIADGAGQRLMFERSLAHPRSVVWQALTDPDQRAEWFFPGTLELFAGGRVNLEHGPGITGEVTEIQDERLLAFTWDSIDGPNSSVRFELTDEPGGTRLKFTHYVHGGRPDNLLAGWHALFDDAAQYLRSGQVSTHSGRFDRLREHYRRRMQSAQAPHE